MWEILQVVMYIAMMFVVSIAKVWPVWQIVDNLVTGVLQPQASTVFCDSLSEVKSKFYASIMLGLQVII